MIKGMFELKKHRVLVVDDSGLMRAAFRDFLTAEGLEVAEAADGAQALDIFDLWQPDLVFMDYVMPGLNGVEACTRLQQHSGGNRVPVIMVTSLDDEASVDAAFAAGAIDYISKPINWAVLRRRLHQWLEARDTRITLDQSEAFARSIIDNTSLGILTIDATGAIKYVNLATATMFGYSAAQLLSMNIRRLLPELPTETNDDIGMLISRALAEGTVAGKRQNGSALPLDCTLNSFCSRERYFWTIIAKDITERQRYEEIIHFQAFYDALTELPNRELLKERISREIAHAQRNNSKVAVMYLDLDRFKLINDTLGHDNGDRVLQEIARRLRISVRATDTVARLGGDEFAILLTDLTVEENIGKIATQALEVIKKPLTIDDQELFLTSSIGIAVYPDDGKDYESLLSNADVAMYQAKEKGKNNFQLYTAALNAKALERLALENSLRRGVDYKEFLVHYQPKVNAKTHALTGMEALVRWQHPQWGLLPPDKFIPLAEETGLIVPIGEWVLRTACQHNKNLQNAGLPPLSVAVNLSARQFEQEDLAQQVAQILQETGLAPEYLELEITESIAMHNLAHTLSAINDLRALGVLFSIDDFGTGYSSLSKLNSISVNKLKIDKSFVQEISKTKDHSVIASTILALGKNLDLEVVAEGVESIEQVAFFQESGCDEMQGYFFGRPMTAEGFQEFFRRKLQIERNGS